MKQLLCILSVLLVLTVLPASADSIAPVAVSGTIGIGGSMTVHKTVTVDAGAPTGSLVDVFFLADTTGSMGGTIGSVRTAAASIMGAAAGLGDVAFGVGEYKDVGDVFVYHQDTSITKNTATVQSGINAWGASGGGDYPEADLYGLDQVATTADWRPGSARILVWMGDAPGHDPTAGGVTLASATADLQANNVKVEAMNLGGLNDYGQATRIAAATGGAYYAGLNSASIVAAINAAISTAFLTYSKVSLDTSEAGPHVTVTFDPGSYAGTYDRSIARTFGFDVTFTGASAGTDSFHIYGLVDGGRVATERDDITVGAVPEPGSILLFGTVLAGIAAGLRRRRQ
jgi:hypothetical protein